MTIFEVADEHASRTGAAIGLTCGSVILASKILSLESLPPLWYIVFCVLVGYAIYRFARGVSYFVYMVWVGAVPLPPLYGAVFDTADEHHAEDTASQAEAAPPTNRPVRDPNFSPRREAIRHEAVGSPAPVLDEVVDIGDFPDVLGALIGFLRENPRRVFSNRALETAGVVKRDPRSWPNAGMVVRYLLDQDYLEGQGNNTYSLNQSGRLWLEEGEV